MLLKRGFSEYDIDTNFTEYKGNWNISTVTKNQIMSASDTEQLNKQDCYARFIEKHRNEFLALRKTLITSLYDKIKNNEINNIDSINFMKARRYMCDIFLPLSEQLKNTFMNEHRNIFKTNTAMKEDI
jgi:hypothetical protein